MSVQERTAVLELKGLTLRLGGITAVNNLNLKIPKGKIYSLIGPNGAGKTSVFNTITGVYQPTEGEILCNGMRMERPLTTAVTMSFVLAGVLTGLGGTVLLNSQSLWDAMITANYTYKQPFPWMKAVYDGVAYLLALPISHTLVPLSFGAVLGAAGTAMVWHRARRTPDCVAQHGIARTFQNIRLFRQMTSLENVLVGMDRLLTTNFWHAALRLPRFWREQRTAIDRARDILRFVNLEEFCDRPAASLPYGYQRKLEIARALALSPEVILLDEPAAGMNPNESQELMELVQKIQATGVTVILIEHHMKVVMGISEHISVLDYGMKIAEGSPDCVRSNTAVIEAYLGKEEVG